jgi:hypothetical protein
MTQKVYKFGKEKLTDKEYAKLIKQFTSEKSVAWQYMEPKQTYWKKRVRIYNNRKKKQSSIGDPLVFTQFQTLLAALYDDKLMVSFNPQERGDTDQAQNLNPLYEADAVRMKKPILDFQWIWNTLFFGRGLVIMSKWDTMELCPKPEIVNILTWLRDPTAKSVNGDASGRGAMRFGGRPIYKTMRELEKDSNYYYVEEMSGVPSVDPELQDAEEVINDAQDLGSATDVDGDNKNYTITEWFTWFNGKRVLIAVTNELQIIRYTVLIDQDEWPIKDKTIFPDPLSWDGTSLLDILEDKQRARARIINAALFNVESNTYNMYLFDANKIRKKSHLNFERNKNIPVNGSTSGAVEPVKRNQVGNEVSFILNWIQDVAQRGTGATEIQQGAMSLSGRTATEIATVSEKADTRFSLASKIFGWSEQEFARYWYKMYKMYFTDKINEKVLRVNGLTGYTWRSLKKSDIIGNKDPDIKVESKVVSEAIRLRKLQTWTNSYNFLSNNPNVNKDFLSREGARLNEYTETDIKMLFMPDSDRVVASEENKALAKGETVNISLMDDDVKHIDEHQKEEITKPNIGAHIQAHLDQIVAKAKNPKIQKEVADMKALKDGPQEEPNAEKQIQPVDFSQPRSIQTA